MNDRWSDTLSGTMGDSIKDATDMLCFSHLRWGFVFQRPQHLMSRFARHRRVFFIEEPEFKNVPEARMSTQVCAKTGVVIATPHLPEKSRNSDVSDTLEELLRHFRETQTITRYIAWFYTPMALEFAREISPDVTVYDCMDELSLFRGAPPRICEVEQQLFNRADLVFTGGASLFESKRSRHHCVYAFPSGVDVAHFRQARCVTEPYGEHNHIPRPRLGYAGVIDERMDLDLIGHLAEQRPQWQIVMLGPVVKIDPASLPRRDNLHWIGIKDYSELPKYFAGWDVGLLPFALNDSTRFISPTKTPEYLAAGLPVVSTPIRDVVKPYEALGLARIARDADEFVTACERAMTYGMSMKWRSRADAFLETLSWDDTWNSMNRLIEQAMSASMRRPNAMAAGRSMGESFSRFDTATSKAS
jgi:UDP-galactopyranose mutase